MSHVTSITSPALLCTLLFGLLALMDLHPQMSAEIFDMFYRSDTSISGGGHAAPPLLEQQTVATGWVASNDFSTGYGAAQVVPGLLLTFVAFLGWTIESRLGHWAEAALATVGIFLPR